MEIVPLNRKILLEPLEEDKEVKTPGGILLPKKEEFGLKKAKVIALGEKVDLKIKKGDIVFYQDIGVDKVSGKLLLDESKVVALQR